MDKQALRSRIRDRKRDMTVTRHREKSEALTRMFLSSKEYAEAKTLYGYLSYNREVDTWQILRQALLDGKAVAVPKCRGRQMDFIWIRDLSGIQKNPRGIPEPIADGPIARDERALVLLPGLAFDPDGNRLGYGGGYYDRFLAREPHHPTIALCFDFQMVSNLELEPWDIPVDKVLWI